MAAASRSVVRAGGDTLMLWAERSGHRRVSELRRGGLRFAFYGPQYSLIAPLLEHYGVQLWMPEAGGRVNFAAEGDEQLMLALGVQSKREITRTRIRVRTAMAAQARDQGRYLGGRPPYGYRLADAGPHPNKAHAAWGRRAHRLEPDPHTAPVVRWMFAQRLAGHSLARIALIYDPRTKTLQPDSPDALTTVTSRAS